MSKAIELAMESAYEYTSKRLSTVIHNWFWENIRKMLTMKNARRQKYILAMCSVHEMTVLNNAMNIILVASKE